jgi:dienelactone hydrolase
VAVISVPPRQGGKKRWFIQDFNRRCVRWLYPEQWGVKARMYFGIAANDDMRQPDAKDKLKAAFAAANVPAEIEVYGSLHGWCVPDMPLQSGKPIYDMTDAERAWGKLVGLYKTALA